MEQIFALVMLTEPPINQTPDDNLISEARLLFDKINQTTSRPRIISKAQEVSNDIISLEQHLTKAKGDKARFYVYKASDLYCLIYKTPNDRLSYLQKMVNIIDDGNADISEREKMLTHFKIADVLYEENKIEESFDYIYRLYLTEHDNFKELLSGFHILLETSILLKKYDIAEKVLNDEFHTRIVKQVEPFNKFAHLNYVKLYLHKADYSKAVSHIIETKKISSTAHNTIQEAQLRAFETIYFYLSGDLDYAMQLITINLKFSEFHSIIDRSPEIHELFKTLSNLIDSRLNNAVINQNLIDSIEQFHTGQWAIFGKLLMRLPKKFRRE